MTALLHYPLDIHLTLVETESKISLIQKQALEIASSIERQSGIMRYLTYDCNTDFVTLSYQVQFGDIEIPIGRIYKNPFIQKFQDFCKL